MKLGKLLRTYAVEPLRTPVPERRPEHAEPERPAVAPAGSDAAADGERRS
jgi:hypothetical protein